MYTTTTHHSAQNSKSSSFEMRPPVPAPVLPLVPSRPPVKDMMNKALEKHASTSLLHLLHQRGMDVTVDMFINARQREAEERRRRGFA